MPIHHDTPENPHTKEPYFAEKTKPFTEMTGTHPISADEPVKPLEDGDDAATTPLDDSGDA
ncbi:MAG TPA: hypothetical protein VF627_10165 [Abditibacterium sp.]